MPRIARWIAVALVACSWAAAPLTLVSTTTIVGDVVGRIAGEENDLTILLPVNADPHAFEPTPTDLLAIARADMVFLNGAGLESNLRSILENAGGRVLELSHGLDLRYPGEVEPHDPGEGHEHDGADPHVWFDPTYVQAWSERIADALAEADPERASLYRDRAAAYRAELADLDSWIREQVEPLPEARRRLVTDHAVLGYFAVRYGFEQVGTVFPGLSSMAQPSARELAALEDAIADLDVPAVFVGTTVNRTLAEQVAADTGIRIVPLYTGSLSGPDGPASSYLELMRYDVTTIVDALSEET